MERQDLVDYLEEEIKRCKEESKKAYKEDVHYSKNPEQRYWDGCTHVAEDILHKLKYEL